MENQTNQSYDSNVLDVDTDIDTDVKINPDFYLHCALVKAQQTFLKDNMQEGFMQYVMFVEHIENLADAASMLGTDYYEKIKDYQKNDLDYTMQTKEIMKWVKLSNKKLNLIMKEVFSRKTATDPMILTFRPKRQGDFVKTGNPALTELPAPIVDTPIVNPDATP